MSPAATSSRSSLLNCTAPTLWRPATTGRRGRRLQSPCEMGVPDAMVARSLAAEKTKEQRLRSLALGVTGGLVCRKVTLLVIA